MCFQVEGQKDFHLSKYLRGMKTESINYISGPSGFPSLQLHINLVNNLSI